MKCLSLLFLIAISLSCSKEDKIIISSLNTPVSNQSLTPNLFTDLEGNVYLSWMEKKEDLAILKFSKLVHDQWEKPKTISQGNNWFVNWADFSSLIVNNGVYSAHWLQKRSEGTYDYDIRVSQSLDDGNSWSESFILHNDGIAAEHGFVSMLSVAEGRNFATWLDGRNTKPEHQSDQHDHTSSGAMTLRAGIFDSHGLVLEDWELDDRTCDCCQTSAAMTNEGPIIAYRDRSEDEVRDIYVTKYVDETWTQPVAVANDNWKISGCPVNGPSITAKGDQVAITWFTGASGISQVKMALSNDGGNSFGKPRVLSQGNTLGRVGTTYLKNGMIASSWLEAHDGIADIMLARFNEHGEELSRISIAQTSSERASGFPVITHYEDGAIMAWTETNEDKTSRVLTAVISF